MRVNHLSDNGLEFLAPNSNQLTEIVCLRFQEREDIESRATARAEFEKTFAFEDTFSLVAAVSHGKGIRQVKIHLLLTRVFQKLSESPLFKGPH